MGDGRDCGISIEQDTVPKAEAYRLAGCEAEGFVPHIEHPRSGERDQTTGVAERGLVTECFCFPSVGVYYLAQCRQVFRPETARDEERFRTVDNRPDDLRKAPVEGLTATVRAGDRDAKGVRGHGNQAMELAVCCRVIRFPQNEGTEDMASFVGQVESQASDGVDARNIRVHQILAPRNGRRLDAKVAGAFTPEARDWKSNAKNSMDWEEPGSAYSGRTAPLNSWASAARVLRRMRTIQHRSTSYYRLGQWASVSHKCVPGGLAGILVPGKEVKVSMRNSRPSHLIILCFVAATISQSQIGNPVVLTPGDEYTAGEIPNETSGLWWVLYRKDGSYGLVQSAVEVDAIHNSCIDETPEGRSGRRVRVPDVAGPVMLLRGIGDLNIAS